MTILKKKFSQDQYKVSYMVDEEHDGMRLDKFLQIYFASFSRQAVKRKINSGEITIEGRPNSKRSSCRVYHQEVVTSITNRSEHEDEYWNGNKIDLQTTPEVVYEDSDIVVISKPPFMATHPTGKHLFNCATVFFESKYKKTVHSIHRLDRETSGILLLGKNPKSANIMTEHFENNLVRKCYFFIAKIDNEKLDNRDYFIEEARLGALEDGLKRVYINNFPKESQLGKSAYTTFKVLHKENGHALGLAFPKTGRQHQIRVHAAINGLPLVGDKLYLGSFKMFQRFKDVIATEEDHDLMQIPRHALHAISIMIPYNGNKQIYTSHVPLDLKSWIKSNMSISINEIESQVSNNISNYFSQF